MSSQSWLEFVVNNLAAHDGHLRPSVQDLAHPRAVKTGFGRWRMARVIHGPRELWIEQHQVCGSANLEFGCCNADYFGRTNSQQFDQALEFEFAGFDESCVQQRKTFLDVRNAERSLEKIFFFFSLRVRRVVRAEAIDRAIPSSNASQSVCVRKGGATFKSGLQKNRSVSSIESVRVKWCGPTSHVTLTPRALASRTSCNPRAVLRCCTCSLAPVMAQISKSRAIRAASAAAGFPGNPSRSEVAPSFITPSPRNVASSA
jgi:hypothetical protein